MMKKLLATMMALVMIVTLSQCKKQNEENEDNTAKVRVSCTIPINKDGKTDFTSDGNVNWSAETERIYLAIPATQELVELISETAAGGSTLTFSGNVTVGSLDITGETGYDVWYLGRSEKSKLAEGSVAGSIANQSGNLEDLGYHHIAKSTVTASEGNNGGIVLSIGTFKNQIAIIKLGEESASTSILRGNAIIGTEYSLEYDGDKYDIAITGEKSINVTNPTNESYVVLFPNEETNVELKSNSSKKVTFLNGIKAGSIYTVGWEEYEGINGYEYVDLGLPSGLLWATCNVGAETPEEYGNYYAWGETETKSEYREENSATYGLYDSQLQSQGYIDGEGNLNPQYDAATSNWGGDWRMPTKAEQQELLNNCTWTWTTQNGVNGYNVEGPNGNSIFLPAAGYRDWSSLYGAGGGGCYWSSTPFESNGNFAYRLYFNGDSPDMSYRSRNSGQNVRPVSGGNNAEPEEPETPETPDNNGHEYVDLGLPSGLLWATCNVGANSPKDCGNYYAWGETETKSEYTQANSLTYGKSLNDISGNPQYDAATANWGGDWRMPTKAEMQELLDNCTFEWTAENGVYGQNVTGPNGSSIFLPASGECVRESVTNLGYSTRSWSSTPCDDNNQSEHFVCHYKVYYAVEGSVRWVGYTIRPVSGGNFTGPEEQPEEPETPDNNGHEYVDLGLPSGLLWATCNVGANSPEAYGDYFAWGETETKSEYTQANSLTYGKSLNDISGNPQYDAATANWGGDWRMPTKDELNELRNNCTLEWITEDDVNGYKVTSNINGKSIFLPATGYRYGTSYEDAGSIGYYWSSMPHENNNGAYYLYFWNGAKYIGDNSRYRGQTIRPVID